jgi:gluconate 5-dehydrogenase
MADAGAALIINGRDEAKLERAANELSQHCQAIQICKFDVTESEQTAAAIQQLEQSGHGIDVLINNAGMQFRTPLESYPQDKWRQLMRTNVDSVFNVSQPVARHMIDRGQGKIINVCSVQSELGRPGIAPYAASKGAVKMLTKGMCADWGRYGIQVNGLGPGYFKTELNAALVEDPEFTAWLERRTPAGRWGNVEELVGAAIFLASNASSFVNGHVLYVDGGITATL